MRHQMTTFLLCLLLLAPGCGDRSSLPTSDAGPDGQVDHDGATPSGWSFTPEGSPQSAAVFIKAGETAGADTLWLEVVAEKIGSLQGLAFRLAYDPTRLEVLQTEQGKAWQLSSTQSVHKFAVRPEGELWAGLGHVGVGSIAAVSPVTLARVKIRLKGTGAIKVGFRPYHNLVLDTQGSTVPVKWLGGALKPVSK